MRNLGIQRKVHTRHLRPPKNESRREAIVGVVVIMDRKTQLFQVISALHSASRFTSCLHCWEQQCYQDSNNGNNYK